MSAQLREFTSLINDLVQLSRGEYAHPAKELLDLRVPINSALERARLRGPQLHFQVTLEPGGSTASTTGWSGRLPTCWTMR